MDHLKEEIKALESELIELRRDIHRHPELGKQEFRTSRLVAGYLDKLGIENSYVYNTGVLGVLRGSKPGKCILLRADMDALPVTEMTDVPFRSETSGVMHACGHDSHTAMLMVAAKVLAAHRDELCGTVKFVFQPDEEGETDTGAEHMVEGGVMENPKPDASFAIHIWSQLGNHLLGLCSGPVWAEQYAFRITLHGKGGHTSAPHEAVDPIIAASAVVQQVQVIQTREINLRDATVICFGSVHGGTASNIIPESVELRGTLRYLYDGSDDKPQHPCRRFEELVRNVAAVYHCKADISFAVGSYVLINDENLVNWMKANVLSKVTDSEKVVPYTVMAGEDFCAYVNRANTPGALMFLGTGDHELGTDVAHHSPYFKIDESNLKTGVEVFVRTAMEFLNGK